MSDKIKFAKIIEIDGEQVLFYLDSSGCDEGIVEELHQIVRIEGVCADLKCGFKTYEQADAAFAKADERMARVVLDTVRGILAGRAAQ